MELTLAPKALKFATAAHAGQPRRYTNEPYIEHPQAVMIEVVREFTVLGIDENTVDLAASVALLHDVIEDCGITHSQLSSMFGLQVADGVLMLSDTEQGNRMARKAAACARVSEAPWWVQSVKCADMIDNAKSIFKHDPKFAVIYRRECLNMLEAMESTEIRIPLWYQAHHILTTD